MPRFLSVPIAATRRGGHDRHLEKRMRTDVAHAYFQLRLAAHTAFEQEVYRGCDAA